MAALESEELKSTMTISKAIMLMQDKHSSSMIQRHQRALHRIALNNKSGYLLKDLFSLCHLLQECADRLRKTPDYEEPLRELIAIFGMGFLKQRVSDESTYATNALEVLSLLGKLCKESTDGIRYEIATAFGAFYEGKTNEELELPEELQSTQKAYNIVLLERSGVVSSLVLSLQLTQVIATQIALLETLLLLSRSAVNSNNIFSVGGASLVCEYLSTGDNKVVFLAVEVLWNLLEEGSQIQVSEQLGSLKSILIFQRLMKELMLTSTSQQYKQLRNDVLMVVSLIASNCSNSPFVETGFLKDLCEYATFSEDEHQVTATHKQLHLSHDDEDFQLKKGLFCLLVTLSSLPAAIRVLSQQKVIRSLFSFVISNDTANTSWYSTQFEELQLLALSCLSIISPHCIEDYITCQGNSRLLLMLEWCIKDDRETQFRGHGNSFHGKGGRGNKMAQLRYSLRLLLSMCSTKDNSILQDLHEQGIIPVLIVLLKTLQKRSNSDNNQILLEIQSDALLILSCLCENNHHRKELFGGYEGVPVIIEYLKRDSSNFSSALGHRLFLAAVDCTWSAVAGNSSVEDIFLEEGGIFVLMDLLQLCPKNMQCLVLGVLVDLCDNSKTIAHVTTWQGKNGVGCWSILAQLWRQEEKDLEVPRDVMGTLAGTTLPLVGAAQSARGMPPLPTHQLSPAIEDITDNMRAKIYSLCAKIGFGNQSESITTEDKISLCLIENYLDFKTGEVWYEVAGELAQEGLRPTTPDQESLQEILQCSEERAEEVMRQQHELIDEQHRQDLDEEYQFYERLRDARVSSERAQERREKLAMRTSNYKHLKEAKQKQTNAIDASRPSAVSLGERFHTVNQSSLNVTAFCSRHVTVETTPRKLLTKHEIPIHKQSTTLSLK